MKRPFFFIFWLIFAILSVPLLWYLGIIQIVAHIMSFWAAIIVLIIGDLSNYDLSDILIEGNDLSFFLGGIFICIILIIFRYIIYPCSLKEYKESNLVNWKVWQKILYIVLIGLSTGIVISGIAVIYWVFSELANMTLCNSCTKSSQELVKESIDLMKRLVFVGYCGFVWCVAVFFAIQSCFKRSK